ncbi:MAG: diaminopimelate decarboxylase [Verrucomicrobiae bacterium]|jgi:diaminopimelate decarboxylase|nr:diaminopimelate decarboxylase [Verrucomicrobiae bacterium]
MHSFYYHASSLHCEGVDLETLSKEVGTPAYIYSATTIRDNFRRLHKALAPLKHRICYATKANSNLAILRLLVEEGAGFDIVSGGELFKVLQAGGRADQCTFAGVGKMAHEIEYALSQGVYCFNVESEGELDLINFIAGKLGCKAPIALRVNPDVDTPTHHYISTGRNKNKFGIGLDRAEEVYTHAASLPHLRIRGIQTHIGSQILTAAPFIEAIKKLTPLIQSISKRHALEFFSIGGGIGIVYEEALASGDPAWWEEKKKGERLSPEEYASKILEPLQQLNIPIFFEPGRFLVGNAGVLLTAALYRKETPEKNFLIVDAGMNDLIRPALYQGYHEIVPLQRHPNRALEKIDVVGPVCESGDFFAQERMLPRMEVGESLAIMSTGAYGFVMGSNYNARPLPPEILIEEKKITVVRRRQSWEDLVREEIIT